jgi:hypothetical protein
MALLQVRDFPDDLYAKVGELAKRERRSIAQQTIVCMQDAVDRADPKARRRAAVARAVALAESTPASTLDIVASIREDRDR